MVVFIALSPKSYEYIANFAGKNKTKSAARYAAKYRQFLRAKSRKLPRQKPLHFSPKTKTKYDIAMPAKNRNAMAGGSRKRPPSAQTNVGDKNIAANASANVPKNVRAPTSPFIKNRATK